MALFLLLSGRWEWFLLEIMVVSCLLQFDRRSCLPVLAPDQILNLEYMIVNSCHETSILNSGFLCNSRGASVSEWLWK